MLNSKEAKIADKQIKQILKQEKRRTKILNFGKDFPIIKEKDEEVYQGLSSRLNMSKGYLAVSPEKGGMLYLNIYIYNDLTY